MRAFCGGVSHGMVSTAGSRYVYWSPAVAWGTSSLPCSHPPNPCQHLHHPHGIDDSSNGHEHTSSTWSSHCCCPVISKDSVGECTFTHIATHIHMHNFVYTPGLYHTHGYRLTAFASYTHASHTRARALPLFITQTILCQHSRLVGCHDFE